MHVLYTVHFNSAHSGLHENVFATAKKSLESGFKVSVLCKDGEFATRLRKSGIQVITSDFESIDDTVVAVLTATQNDYDIIHTHPGPSRKVALKVSEERNVPLFMTFHGMWKDSIARYADKLTAIFPVSEGVKDFIRPNLDNNQEKLVVMPNGVNKKLFKPKKELIPFKRDKVLNISLVSRLDQDKDFIIELFYKALQFTTEKYQDMVTWTIVGDGTKLDEMERRTLEITGNGQTVNFLGWKTNKSLYKSYLNSDIVIAPGRCVLEAMSCGKPVIAIGSKKYNGLVDKGNWLNGMYTNFGGIGNKMDDYVEGTIEKDLTRIIESSKLRNELGDLGIFITDKFYDEDKINSKIIGLYQIFKKTNN